MSEQFFSTTRLSNVTKLIALGNQTGILQVMRGSGAMREEGMIQFVDGRYEAASVGQLHSNAALAVLLTWGDSIYQFLDGVNRMSITPQIDWITQANPRDSMPPPSSGSFPSAGGSGTNTGGYPASSGTPSHPSGIPAPGSGTLTGMGSSQPGGGNTGSMPGYPPGSHYPPGTVPPGTIPGSGYLPGYPPPTTRSWGPPAAPHQSQPMAPAEGQQGSAPYAVRMGTGSFSAGYVPQRPSQFDTNGLMALDRRERQLLLLVDGRRTLHDLVRLTRRSEEEVQAILGYLVAMHLIK